jgi:nucleotide-binding universal stress UspA family protein
MDPRTILPIGRVLVPIDFSNLSRAAVECAVALAGPARAEITAVFVLPSVAHAAGETAAGSCADEADDNMMSAIAEDVEEFLRPARTAGLPVRVSVKRGDTVAQILEQARETEADVIVMATHGRWGVERWVLGSVLDGVLRKAPCPILAVPRPLRP